MRRGTASWTSGKNGIIGNRGESYLDVVVHVYVFRMTRDEILDYMEQNILPDRFQSYENDLRNYALTANGVTYMQRAAKDGKQEKYRMPENVTAVAEYLDLLIKRKIFVE